MRFFIVICLIKIWFICSPLVQSPVKKKVEAFENAAANVEPAKTLRNKRIKENVVVSKVN